MLRSVLWAIYIYQTHRKAKADRSECLRKIPSESVDFCQQETSTLVKQMPRPGDLKVMVIDRRSCSAFVMS